MRIIPVTICTIIFFSFATANRPGQPSLARYQSNAEPESVATFVAKAIPRCGAQRDPYNGYGYYDDDDQNRQFPNDDWDTARHYEEDYGLDEYGYEDADNLPSRRRNNNNYQNEGNRFVGAMPSFITKGNRQIGLGLLGAGAVFTLLGISLFFNKTLMRLGNLLFIAGVPTTIGPGRTAGYFFQPKKSRATGCLAVGIFLVLIGYPVFGIILEIFGLLNLFGNMFPVFLAIAKQMPIIGPILSGNNNNNKSNNASRNRRDRYYNENDDGYYDDRQYYDDPRYNNDDEDDDYNRRY